MGYLHYDIVEKQSAKRAGEACGDYITYYRTENALFIVLSDGLGSGIKANIAAQLCATRLISLIKNGASMREAFQMMVKNMNNIWGKGYPFAVFSIAKILSNGEATVLSYEIPPPIVIGKYSAAVLSDQVSTIGKAIVYESSCTLREDEGLMMVSDGITQAGLGCGLVNGWEIQGVASFITKHIMGNEIKASDFVEIIHAHARRLWRKAKGDDCSVVMAYVRRGITVNMISGPPSDDRLDKQWLDGFINSPGIKVVCGGTTSKVVARELKKTITLATEPVNLLSPPKYEISGITLVTEGIVTLNQVFNILGEDTSEFIDESPVYELNNLLNNADKVIFYIGHAYNPGIGNIQFRQQGILSRKAIIPLIIDKLRKSGKLVIVHEWE